jgi:hypothetical protein
MFDADLRGGISVAAPNSIQRNIAAGDVNMDGKLNRGEERDNGEGVVMPVFGMTLGVGFTF